MESKGSSDVLGASSSGSHFWMIPFSRSIIERVQGGQAKSTTADWLSSDSHLPLPKTRYATK